MESHKSLLANASHELRSPLARIRMGLELMGIDAASPQRQEISRSITELDQLIDEILLASRLDAKQADAEPFETLDLTGLAAEECARVNAELSAELGKAARRRAGHGRHQPQPDRAGLAAPPAPADPQPAGKRQALQHRRHQPGTGAGPRRQQATGRGQGARPRPGRAGRPARAHFEPFYRLPGASEREGGVGLGLALVKSISQRHGGSVRCEARPGGGASFIVELPVAHAMAPADTVK
jgi:signal transduction histidine kinase